MVGQKWQNWLVYTCKILLLQLLLYAFWFCHLWPTIQGKQHACMVREQTTEVNKETLNDMLTNENQNMSNKTIQNAENN